MYVTQAHVASLWVSAEVIVFVSIVAYACACASKNVVA